jgi:hypothetical protein
LILANTRSGSQWLTQPHGAPSFAGTAPQGYLAATDSHLLIPSSRGAPGVYDSQTGAFIYGRVAGKNAGGYAVSGAGDIFINSRSVYRIKDGGKISKTGGILTPDAIYSVQGEKVSVYSQEKKGLELIAEARLKQKVGRAFIKAGPALYCARNDGTVSAVTVVDPKSPSVTWPVCPR